MKIWIWRIARYLAIQGLSQVLAFVTGLLIVRSLHKVNYAYYAIAIAAISAGTLLSDSGIRAALMSKGARFFENKQRLGRLYANAYSYRARFGSIIFVLCLGVLAWLLNRNAASVLQNVTYVALVGACFVPIIGIGILEPYHRLNLNITLLQWLSLGIAGLRLVLVVSLVEARCLTVATVLAANCICFFVNMRILRTRALRTISLSRGLSGDRAEDFGDFSANIRRTFPTSLLLISGEQIYLVLLSVRGSATVVAEATAMSRFAVAFVIVNSLISDVAAPILARTPVRRRLLAYRTAAVIGGYLLTGAALVIIVYFLRTPLLLLLGPEYAGLNTPLLIFAAGYALSYAGYCFDTLNQARGWLRFSWTYIPLTFLWLLFGIGMLDLKSIEQASVLFLLLGVPLFVMQCCRFVAGLASIKS